MEDYKVRVQIPQVVDLRTAIRLFYEKNELSPKDVREIFGCSAPTAAKLIRRAGAGREHGSRR